MKGRYPILSVVTIRILSILPTSRISERNCSTFGFIHTKLRNKNGRKKLIIYSCCQFKNPIIALETYTVLVPSVTKILSYNYVTR
ncbi:hypothetical protein C1646_682031 [Rhizophagus diaphanus]|nr:hypothetical protein C1646_682031 [Rhizophagus diaphanus] [Rhizophagus sp. MUCL 43196]